MSDLHTDENAPGSDSRRQFLKGSAASLTAVPMLGLVNSLMAQSPAPTHVKLTAPIEVLSRKIDVQDTATGKELLFDTVLKGAEGNTSTFRSYLRYTSTEQVNSYSYHLSQQWFENGSDKVAGDGAYSAEISQIKGKPDPGGETRTSYIDITLINPHGTVVTIPRQTVTTKISSNPWVSPDTDEWAKSQLAICGCGTDAHTKPLPTGIIIR